MTLPGRLKLREEQLNTLCGQILFDGWVLESPRVRHSAATGGCHSMGFTAKNSDGRRAFVKVMDPTPNINIPENEQLIELEQRLAIFNYERDLLDKCLQQKIKRVVRILNRGTINLPGFPIAVHYMMFELAERDLREHANLEDTLDTTLNLHVLHQCALALEALHFHQIAHQDLKPSNVLLFEEHKVKLGDLGCAHERGVLRPDSYGAIAGDPGHAPPEQLYGYLPKEWSTRRLATDLYLLGSLITFMFTNVSMTAQIGGQLHPQHHWTAWAGSYKDVLPYVREAWDAVLEELRDSVLMEIQDELVSLTRYLTNPEPECRGHPRNLEGSGSQFGVRRFSSRFHVLVRQSEYKLRQGRDI